MIKYSTIRKYQSLILWLVFFLISFLFFSKTLNNFFVSDDFHWLVIARDTEISWRIFLTNYEGNTFGGSYNPLLVFIFKFFYNFFGLNYFVYHLFSILLHSLNAFLVFLLSNRIFSFAKFSNTKIWAFIAGLLFLIWPIQVEVISWVAAWPHLWATSFYILSLIKYIDFKSSRKRAKLFLSILFFIIALLIKEIAISLPFVILMLEIYFISINNRNKLLSTYFYISGYFLILVLFFCIRFFSTGLFFGYYGSHILQISINKWLGNLAAYLGDFFTFSFIRSLMYKAIYHYSEIIIIILLLSLILYFSISLFKKKFLQVIIFSVFLFLLAPMLITDLHHLTFAGERYMYLPSSLFVIWILLVLYNFHWFKKNKFIIFILFLLLSSIIICYKNIIWRESSMLSKQIVDSYSLLKLENDQKLVSVSLPDNLLGGEVFRNNLQQALELYYPDNHPDIYPLPVYTRLNLENYNKSLLKWKNEEKGWLGESRDGGYIVTGKTSITINDVYFELWGYNYQNFTSNIIRLYPKDEDTLFLIFDKGRLKLLK